MNRDVAWLEANPVADTDFTINKQEAIRRGIYYRPVCECGCGEASIYVLGSRRSKTKEVYVASWECRTRVRQAGRTCNTKMTSYDGVRFVTRNA